MESTVKAQTPPKHDSLPGLGRWALLSVLVMVGLNGVVWALWVPPWHTNDEVQHYLYAAMYSLPAEVKSPGVREVAEDTAALAYLVDFGPHRVERRPINPRERLGDELDDVLAVLDDPDAALRYQADRTDIERLVFHPEFVNYHPPLYPIITGQWMRVMRWLDWGMRERLLGVRMLSVVFGVVTAWLAWRLARVIWPTRWGVALLAALVMGLQVRVTFYTSVGNHESLNIMLATATLWLGAALVRDGLSWGRSTGLGGVLFAGLATKATMGFAVAGAMLAVVFSPGRAWVRWAMAGLMLICVAGVTAYLTIPLGAESDSVVHRMTGGRLGVRSFPLEMFSLERLNLHRRAISLVWGGRLGDTGMTTAYVPRLAEYAFVLLNVVLVGLGLLRLRQAEPEVRRMLIWLLLTPLFLVGLMYVVDYRFASISGGVFSLRGQYYAPAIGAMVIWMLWGLGGNGVSRRAMMVSLIGGLGVVLMQSLVNADAIVNRIWPRYFGDVGLGGVLDQINLYWNMPGWMVIVSGIAASVAWVIAVVLVTLVGVREARQADTVEVSIS